MKMKMETCRRVRNPMSKIVSLEICLVIVTRKSRNQLNEIENRFVNVFFSLSIFRENLSERFFYFIHIVTELMV